MEDKSFEEILNVCEGGLGTRIDPDDLKKLYGAYVKLFPILSETKYMFVEEEDKKPKSVWFFMEKNIGIVTLESEKFELFPIKNRITRLVLDKLNYAEVGFRGGIITISFSFQTESNETRTLKEADSRKKCNYLSRLLSDYFLPNLV